MGMAQPMLYKCPMNQHSPTNSVNGLGDHLTRKIGVQTPEISDTNLILATCEYLTTRHVPKQMSDWTIQVANLLSNGISESDASLHLGIARTTCGAAVTLIREAAFHAGWNLRK